VVGNGSAKQNARETISASNISGKMPTLPTNAAEGLDVSLADPISDSRLLADLTGKNVTFPGFHILGANLLAVADKADSIFSLIGNKSSTDLNRTRLEGLTIINLIESVVPGFFGKTLGLESVSVFRAEIPAKIDDDSLLPQKYFSASNKLRQIAERLLKGRQES